MLDRQREHVAATCHVLAGAGLVLGTAGNVSERDGDLVAITPTGAVLADITAADVVVVDRAGTLVDGALEPTSEVALHLGIYDRYGAGGVVHAHSPVSTAVGCVIDALPLIHYQLLALGGPIRVVPYATFGTAELAELTLQALDGRAAALMSNHGMIATGGDVAAALENARLLEWGCELYWRASSIGTPRTLSQADADAFREAVSRRGYGSTHEAGRR